MAEMERKNPFRIEISPTVSEMFHRLGGSMNGALGFVLSHPRVFAPILKKAIPSVSATAGAMLRTTLAFTVANGSQGANVLPREAYLIANMRYSHHEGKEASIAAVKKVAERFGIETEVIQDGFESALTDWRSKGFCAVEDAVHAVFPDVMTVPYVMAAASDCRYMGRVSDCCLRFVPFKITNEQMASVHGVDENLDISALAPAVDFYKILMQTGAN
jgi:carboxypeptidase PM20D1